MTKKAAKSSKNTAQRRIALFVVYACAIFAIGFAAYDENLDHDFTNWDDPTYVTENPTLQLPFQEQLRDFFDPSKPVSLNYHPITMLSLSANHARSGLKARGYHSTNILLHCLNGFLVFCLIYLLFHKQQLIAAICAFIFLLHPMHVESVAWIAERKDVLYCLFYLASLIAFNRFRTTQSKIALVACFLFFALACLSKAMAVVIPLSLLLLDWQMSIKQRLKSLVIYIPFFVFSLLIGLLALKIQSAGAINEFDTFSIFQRIQFASYGLLMYLVKFIAPVSLSAFYPYPTLLELDQFGWLYALLPIIALIIAVLVIKFGNRRNGLSFGMAFFFVNLILVLQFISVGSAIMADRYTYVSYIGLSLPFAIGISHLFEQLRRRKAIYGHLVLVSLLVFGGTCFALTKERVSVWRNSETLWTDVISKHPDVEVAYRNRGNYYGQQGMTDKAEADYRILVEQLKSTDAKIYSNLGNIYGLKRQFDKAQAAYSRSLQLDSNNFDAYMNRGVTYSMMKDYKRALSDFDRAAQIQANHAKLIANRAYAQLEGGQPEAAIESYSRLISSMPGNGAYHQFRALAHYRTGNTAASIADFKTCIQLNPQNGEAWFNLSKLLLSQGNRDEALQAAQNARRAGHPAPNAHLQALSKE